MKPEFKLIAIIFISLFYSKNSVAQDPYYINYTIEDGLPTSNVYSIFQENNGIIWFTTDVGIVKYNSKNFKLYNTDDGLSDNEVFKMNADLKGRVWLQTLNGKPCYIYKNKIYNNLNTPFLKNIKGNGMSVDFFLDTNKTIYLTSRNGQIVSIDNKNKINYYHVNNPSLSGSYINNDSIYTLSSEFIYNVKNNKIVKNLKSKNQARIYHFDNKTIISQKNELYDLKNNDFYPILKLDYQYEIINVYKETKDLWWICTRNGLFQYKNGAISKPFFKDFVISDILKDFEGNYWISTLNKGILYLPSFSITQLLKENKIKCLASNNNNLWIGGEFNNYYCKNKKSILYYSLNKNWKKDKISNIRFYNNEIYINGKSGLKIIKKTNEFTEYIININDILVKEKNYYIATIFTAKLPINQLNKGNIDFIFNKTILHKRTNILTEGKNNDIWIGTNLGLYKYNPKDSITDFSSKNEFLNTSIEDLYYDIQNNLLFVATASKGISIINKNNEVKNFNLIKGLNSNTCISIKKISRNLYLIGTNNGMNLLNIMNSKISNLNSTLGIRNKRIRDIEIVNDTTYLATDFGILSFDINYIKNKVVKPKCIITALKNEDGLVKNNSTNYDKRDISIAYNGISYIDNGDVTFYYKLKNHDKKWYSTKETEINYKSLPANKYNFAVYCINGLGEKSTIQNISFEIVPPFWQKLWFKFLIFSVLSLFIYLFIKIRFKKQQARFEAENLKIKIERDTATLEKQMIELEQKALRMQMNPHFIFNALNTIKGYYSEGNDEKASDYISKFSMLLRMLLENTEPTISLATEIKMLELYINLTKIRYKNSFQFSINVDQNLSIEEIAIPTLLLQPLVENAIIHGLSPKKENGKLIVSFKKINNQLECIVEDNGIGRTASLLKQKHKQHESKAIEITKERLNLLENDFGLKTEFLIQDLYNKSNIGIGTIVTIKIPFKYIW